MDLDYEHRSRAARQLAEANFNSNAAFEVLLERAL
jgi:hypothetical protein